jgi:hypothetical protein
MKLGIVGSSFSTGGHYDVNKMRRNPSFTDLIKQQLKIDTVYNAAQSGMGMERYLSSIVYLKKNYDIDHLLVEIINDRTPLYTHISEEYPDVHNEEAIYGVDNAGSYTTFFNNHKAIARWLHRRPDLRKFFRKQANVLFELSTEIALDVNRQGFYRHIALSQVIDLCKLLDIKVTAWMCHHSTRTNSPYLKDVMQEWSEDFTTPNVKIVTTYDNYSVHSAKRYLHECKIDWACKDGVHLNCPAETKIVNILCNHIEEMYK